MRLLRNIMGTTLGKRPFVIFCVVVICIVFLALETQISQLTSSLEALKKQSLSHNIVRDQVSDSHLSFPLASLQMGLPVVVYNRVSKTGSTSFTNQIYSLTKQNKIYVLHVNTTKNSLKMSLIDQVRMVQNVSTWEDRMPSFYHGHFAYVRFSQFGGKDPLYINILREPLERLVSYYYFLRYGDDYRKGLKRVKQGDTTTFDQCWAKQGHDCRSDELWMQIPMLCGQTAECWKVGSEWALNQAKQNLISKYLLVGLTEEMEDFVVVLEASVPQMFTGLADKFRSGKKSHIRKTLHKVPPSEKTLSQIKATKAYKMERDLYDFAKSHFDYIKLYTTYTDSRGKLQPLNQKFRYEKVYGPKGFISNK